MKLVYMDTKKPVAIGDCVTLRGVTYTVDYFRKPHAPSSSGKVSLRLRTGGIVEYYVNVIGAEWIEREDREPTPADKQELSQMVMATLWRVVIELEVHDPESLYAAAVKAAEREGCTPDEAELRGEDGAVDIAACLTMCLDPGSLAGCDINASQVE